MLPRASFQTPEPTHRVRQGEARATARGATAIRAEVIRLGTDHLTHSGPRLTSQDGAEKQPVDLEGFENGDSAVPAAERPMATVGAEARAQAARIAYGFNPLCGGCAAQPRGQ